ncbi:Carrier protein, mitochondrial [Coemansia sp. RSA 1290]|nr:Carrier protein, mitochondrial [Coemansia sp. RSA 1086]KAJ1752279.1 Carrier protein, mitochondrial [Coemansia sp. RSA 1821]KAJ2631325.1 Carrier protein, mitochondrial [Coemansia sp. RSA 1290]
MASSRESPAEPGLQSKILSACTGAVITSLLMTPFDVVKTRQQSQTLVRADALLPAIREWRAMHHIPRNARHMVDLSPHSCLYENTTRKTLSLSLRRTASMCLCTDLHLQPGKGELGKEFFSAPQSEKTAETWKRLYRELIAMPYARHEHRWQQMVGTGAEVVPRARGERIHGTIAGMRHIAQTEGLWKLWRGLAPTLVASGPSTVIYFVGYDYLRQWMGQQMKRREQWAPYEKYSSLAAGCIARTSAVTAISPIELVRTRMQASATHDFHTVISGIRSEIANDGLRILWRGLVPTLWRDVPFSALYWFGFERWREAVYQPVFGSWGLEGAGRIMVAFCSGASSGVIAATLTTPFDVAKTRRQVQNSAHAKPGHVQYTLAHIVRQIAATEGVKGLFAGLTPRLMKVVPSCAIMISTYELGKMLATFC